MRVYEDAGISGSEIENRPALCELLSDAKAKKFQRVIVSKLDRVARDTFACLWIEKELRKYGIELFSIAEPFRWSDPTQKIFLQIISTFAEFEKTRIQERLTSGRAKKALSGGFAGGGVARGYKTISGKLVPDNFEASIIKRIFELRKQLANGKPITMQKIADILNQEKIPSSKGKKFYASTIQYILSNKIYEGEIKYGDFKARGIHQPISIT